MSEREKIAVLQRLRTVHGHVGGVIRMAEHDVSCVDLLRQIEAVQSALGKVAGLILEYHLDRCLSADVGDRGRVVGEIRDIFETGLRTAQPTESELPAGATR